MAVLKAMGLRLAVQQVAQQLPEKITSAIESATAGKIGVVSAAVLARFRLRTHESADF
jgi:hypothetical protein